MDNQCEACVCTYCYLDIAPQLLGWTSNKLCVKVTLASELLQVVLLEAMQPPNSSLDSACNCCKVVRAHFLSQINTSQLNHV